MPRKSKHKAPGRKRRATTKTVAAAAPAPPIADRITEAVADRVASISDPLAQHFDRHWGVTPEQADEIKHTLLDIGQDKKKKDADRINAMLGVVEGEQRERRLEIEFLKVAATAALMKNAPPAASVVVSDEELAKGLQLLLAMEPTKTEETSQAVNEDDDLILPLEGVG